MAAAKKFQNITSTKATLRQFRTALQNYSNLISAPPCNVPAGQLEAQRIHAAALTVRAALTMRAPSDYNRSSISHDLAEMAKSAPVDRKSCIDALLAERIMLDTMHSLRAAAKAGK